MLRGTIDFYHFIPLSLTLTFPEGHKVSAKPNLLALFSHTLSNWSGWHLCGVEANQIEHPGTTLESDLVKQVEITADLLIVGPKKQNVSLHSDIYKLIWLKLVWW